jgi:hypothetical protein
MSFLRNVIFCRGFSTAALKQNASLLRIRPVYSATRLSSYTNHSARGKASRDTMFYVISLGVVATGLTFAAIPAYRMFCEATSFGGLTQVCFLTFLSNAFQLLSGG